jgi:hypothetical protein
MTTRSVFAVLMSTLLLSGPGGVARASDRPSDIQRQIAKIERQYFALYNRLNDDPKYDIVCRGRLDDGRRAMQVLRGSPELQALGVKLESLQIRQTPQ